MPIIAGGVGKFLLNLTNPDTDALENATGELTLTLTGPDGSKPVVGEPTNDSTGKYHLVQRLLLAGLWHYLWEVAGKPVAEGYVEVESERPEGPVDLTDLKVLLPRARRKIEGPWGNPNGKAPLGDTVIYNMIGDAVGEVIMLSGSLFGHQLEVKARDPLGGFPTAWKTSDTLQEYEAAIICAQVALDYYQYLFRDQKVSETIQNEGTVWTYELSANAIRSYYEGLVAERDHAIAGLRVNRPVFDQYVSNIRVRDIATVSILEWWDTNSPRTVAGGLPGGQEASVVPWFAGQEGGIY